MLAMQAWKPGFDLILGMSTNPGLMVLGELQRWGTCWTARLVKSASPRVSNRLPLRKKLER